MSTKKRSVEPYYYHAETVTLARLLTLFSRIDESMDYIKAVFDTDQTKGERRSLGLMLGSGMTRVLESTYDPHYDFTVITLVPTLRFLWYKKLYPEKPSFSGRVQAAIVSLRKKRINVRQYGIVVPPVPV